MVSSRSGRRPGDSGSRERILRAARSAFAERGHGGATLRAIAARAEVDPALVLHYFGSKDALFAAAVELPVDPAALVAAATDGPEDEAGLRVARIAVGAMDDPRSRDGFLGILRSSTADPRAAEMLRDLLVREVYGPIARRLARDHADLRAALVGSQIIGVVLARHVVRLEPLASMPAGELVAWLAPALQRHLTGPAPAGAEAGRETT